MKIYLNYQNVRSVKKKTHIKKRSLNPVFNESFIFDLPSKEGSLDDIQLEVVMCDWDRITKNEVSDVMTSVLFRLSEVLNLFAVLLKIPNPLPRVYSCTNLLADYLQK